MLNPDNFSGMVLNFFFNIKYGELKSKYCRVDIQNSYTNTIKSINRYR